MKKYTIISLFAIIIGITYFVVRANAMPQGTKHELMNVHYTTLAGKYISVSTSDGQGDAIKIQKEDISQVLIKLKEFEDQGWKIQSFTTSAVGGTYRDYTQYDYLLER